MPVPRGVNVSMRIDNQRPMNNGACHVSAATTEAAGHFVHGQGNRRELPAGRPAVLRQVVGRVARVSGHRRARNVTGAEGCTRCIGHRDTRRSWHQDSPRYRIGRIDEVQLYVAICCGVLTFGHLSSSKVVHITTRSNVDSSTSHTPYVQNEPA